MRSEDRPTALRLRSAWICYGSSVAAIVGGVLLAARSYPERFDWTRSVISALASRKHNPDGSLWFAGALGLAMALLWPVANALRPRGREVDRLSRGSAVALRIGFGAGLLVGLERLTFVRFSDLVHRGHEMLALVAFLGVFAGVLGLHVQALRRGRGGMWMSLVVVLPLVAIGACQLWLYLGQRGIGWLDHDWRQSELPVWARFAFWQWLAFAALWLGIGHLLVRARDPVRPSPRRGVRRQPLGRRVGTGDRG